MKQHSSVLRYFSVFLTALVLLSSCKKVNEATELGGDLIPPVDNVTTFDTILEVQAYNYPFGTGDSVRSVASETHFIGNISDDPLLGKTSASLFLQLLPQTIKTPFAFTNKNNLIALDSVVLVLRYSAVYGDSTKPQRVQVFEVGQNSAFVADSLYLIDKNGFSYNTPISDVREFLPTALNDSLRLFRETAANQLRLRLSDDFGNRLLQYDSTNAYKSYADFKNAFKGFAVVPQNGGIGNALIGVNLADTNTKLAIYYRYNKDNQPDTAVTYFRFSQYPIGSDAAADAYSAFANYLQRDRTGSEFAQVAGDNNPDPLIYIQNAPGTFARLEVPGLKGLTNRIVHRAELLVQQVPDLPYSSWFGPPAYLYLDAYDSVAQVYRSIPYDVGFGTTGQIANAALFGMIPNTETGPDGNRILVWRFNISQYVQRIANGTLQPYSLRLSSPFFLSTNIGITSTSQGFFVNPAYAVGRVRVGGGNHPSQPMRLRIIYSVL